MNKFNNKNKLNKTIKDLRLKLEKIKSRQVNIVQIKDKIYNKQICKIKNRI